MNDSLKLFGADASRVCCAAGHPVQGALSTKAFDCLHDEYFVFEGRLHRSKRDDDDNEPVPSLEEQVLVLTRRSLAPGLDFTGEAEAYTHCEICDPIVYERGDDDRVDHRHVWCEWSLRFDSGRLMRVDAVRLETRESLRNQMLRDGVGVLPDDDRIAKKHIKQVREGRRWW